MTSRITIPADFEMGVATSSWQIEGDSAGRGRCIWDDFADRPGAIVDATKGDPACDHVRRFSSDLDLIDWIGADSYRFSISWPRVQPSGSGPMSSLGLDFYDRLIDGLLERGISPTATLYHWDLPSALAGTWLSRDTSTAFADYAESMVERYSDRVHRWATLNEPWVSSFLSYAAGIHAPGHRDAQESLVAAHHLMLAHGMAVTRMREAGARNIGIVLNLQPVYAADEQMADIAAHVDRMHNGIFLDLLAGRGWSPQLREDLSAISDFSFVHERDEETIATKIDWLGENYYSPMRIAPATDETRDAFDPDVLSHPGTPPATFLHQPPVTEMNWEIYPQGIVDILQQAARALPEVPIWITENGAAFDDVLTVESDGTVAVHDDNRIGYIAAHLEKVLQARGAGIDVRGYFAWSLFDNIEWAEGWTKRFGIVRVSPDDQTRIPKDSALWLRDRIAERGPLVAGD